MNFNWAAAFTVTPGMVILLFGFILQNLVGQEQAEFVQREAKKSSSGDISVHLKKGELLNRFGRDGDRVQLPLAILSITPGLIVYLPLSIAGPFCIVIIAVSVFLTNVGIGKIPPGKYNKYKLLGFSAAYWAHFALLLSAFAILLLAPSPLTPKLP